jgi:PTS system mannose-specific IID component
MITDGGPGWVFALAVGAGYYLSYAPWVAGLAYYTLYRPLVAGLVVGLLAGDPALGIVVGALVNLVQLAAISGGAALPGDPALAGWVGAALAVGGPVDPGPALVAAILLAMAGVWLQRICLRANGRFVSRADAAAARGDVAAVSRWNWAAPQLLRLAVSVVPVTLAVRFLVEPVADGVDRLPAWTLWALAIAAGLLPAVGIAACLRSALSARTAPWFAVGLILTAVLDVPVVPVAVLAAVGAWLQHLTSRDAADAAPARPRWEREVVRPLVEGGSDVSLTRRDVNASWWRWIMLLQSAYGFERLQSLGFAQAMIPAIRRFDGGDDERTRASLQRHLVFFNTEPFVGSVIGGAALGMEEDRARGAQISDQQVNAVKTGLMGPVAGVGDSLLQQTFAPLLLAIGIGVVGLDLSSGSGSAVGPVLFLLVAAPAALLVSRACFVQGYRQGRSVIATTLRSGVVDRVVAAARIVLVAVLGSLTATFVVVRLGPVVDGVGLQSDLLDRVVPALLPVLLVLGLCWLLSRAVTPLQLLAGLLAVSFVAAAPVFGDAPTSDRDRSACSSTLLQPHDPCATTTPDTRSSS